MLLKTSNSVRQTAVVLCPECVSAATVLLVGLELVVRVGPYIISRGENCCAGGRGFGLGRSPNGYVVVECVLSAVVGGLALLALEC